MFPRLTEALVKKLSADLISNDDLNREWELLTLVRIRKKDLFSHFKSRDKYKPLALKLSRITAEDLSLEPETEILVEDFHISSCFGGGGEVGGGSADVQVDVAGEVKNVDESSMVTLMSEHFNFQDLEERSIRSMKLEQKILDMLPLKEGDKLAFVKQRVFNTGPVDVSRETSSSGSVGTKFPVVFSARVKLSSSGMSECSWLAWDGQVTLQAEKADKSKFTVPKNKTFAFALKELIIEDGALRFSSELFVRAETEIVDSEKVRMLLEGFQRNQNVLQPLAGRRYLLKDLMEILEDREALALLEDTLDQIHYGEYQRPQSEAVVWFMALLDVSSASRDLTDAVHLLVGALEALPDNIPALLAKCDLQTLNCIIHMMGRLVCGQARHPQPLLRPLLEDGELHWMAKLLCSGNNLRDLKGTWDCPDLSPEGLLELLYVSVRGLSLMQSSVHS